MVKNIIPKSSHPDQKYIEALVTHDHKLLAEIYKRFSGKIISFVERNNGDIEEAKDIIQETLIVIYQQAREKKLELTCPFEAYFLLLCKRRWLNKLKLKNEVTRDSELISIADDKLQDAIETEFFESKKKLLESKFQELSAKCQEILKLSFTLPSMEEVAAGLKISYAYARKKKSLCIGKLTELVQSSPEYKKLKGN